MVIVDNFGNRMRTIHAQSAQYRSDGDMKLLRATAKYGKGESATPVLDTFYRRCYRLNGMKSKSILQ